MILGGGRASECFKGEGKTITITSQIGFPLPRAGAGACLLSLTGLGLP